MLKNYYKIDENSNMYSFLRRLKDKKNSHYIILNTEPETFISMKQIALKTSNLTDKLKNIKITIPKIKSDNSIDIFQFLVESGSILIKSNDKYYDFIDGLKFVKKTKNILLNKKIHDIFKNKKYSLSEKNKISQAKQFLINEKTNLIPITENDDVIGEIRTIDFLISDFTETEHQDKKIKSLFDLEIINLMNKNPIIVDCSLTLKDLINILIKKQLDSVIITNNNKLEFIVSYQDIFKLFLITTKTSNYRIEYIGINNFFEDQIILIKKYSENFIKKISNRSKYNHLKLQFKIIGNKIGGHKRKFEINYILSGDKDTLSIKKEISAGTSDEIFNDRVKDNWNIVLMFQEGLKVLEKKVFK